MYVVIASNANHVRLIGPAAETLRTRGADVCVLTTDGWYDQGAAAAASALSCHSEELPPPPIENTEDWFSTPWDRRLLATEAAAPRIRATLEQLSPTAVILGNDTGLLEQLVITSARAMGVPTIVTQDADFVASQGATRPTGQLLLGEGGCDAVLSWGPRGAEYYRALGLSIPIYQVGSPKIGDSPTPEARTDLRRRFELEDAPVVLVPLQCCARYGMLSEGQEQAHFLDIVDSASASGTARVMVTPHPSHSPEESAWYRTACSAREEVIWVDDHTSTELLGAADVVVGIDSAFLLDAVALGTPDVAVTCGLKWAKTEYENAIPVFSDAEAFRSYAAEPHWIDATKEAFEREHPTFVRRLLAASGDQAAGRMANAINAVSEDVAESNHDAPVITCLLRVTDDDVDGLDATMRSIGSQRAVRTDTRVIDATTDGLGSKAPVSNSVQVLRDRDPSIGRAIKRAIKDVQGPVALWESGVTALPRRLASARRALNANPQADAVTADVLCAMPSGPVLARHLVPESGTTLPIGWRSSTTIQAETLRTITSKAFWPADRELMDLLIGIGRWRRIPEAHGIIDDERSRAQRPYACWEDGLRSRRPRCIGETVDLSVVICTFNRPDVTLACLESFCRQTAPSDSYEIILVDDSTDATLSDLVCDAEWPVRTRFIKRERGSLASARNAAIQVANGTHLLFVNDDTIAFPECVQEHVRAHQMAPDPISVLGTFEQPAAALDGALMRYLEQSTEVFCYGILKPGQRYDWTRYWTCNVSSPADAVQRVGGFDESFESYGCEDTDLGYRLDQIGLPVLYHGAARAHHRHILSFDDLQRRQVTVARAWTRLINKHPQMLEHSEWTWVQGVSRESAARVTAAHATTAPIWERGARTLAGSDIGGLALLGDIGSKVANQELAALGEVIRRLNQLWWHQGFEKGLTELGLSDFSSLLHALPGPLDTRPRPHVLLEIDDEITSAHLPSIRAALERANGGTLGVCARAEAFEALLPHLVAAAGSRAVDNIVPIKPTTGESARRRLLRKMDVFVPDAATKGDAHLHDARVAGVEIVQAATAYLLASCAPLRVLAYPDWRSPSGIEELLSTFGTELADREDICLALVLDPVRDPPLEEILPVFTAAHASVMGAATTLNALIIDDVPTDAGYDELIRAVHAVLATSGPALTANRVCRSGTELRALISAIEPRADKTTLAATTIP